MKDRLMRIIRYIITPLLFAILGYSTIYIIAAPDMRMLISTFSLVLGQETPYDRLELKTIYKVDALKEESKSFEEPGQPEKNEIPTESNEVQKPAVEDIVNIKEIQYPKMGEHYAMLTCERIQLDVPVYWGDTTKILNAGVGQFMGSFLPGFNRSILLSAHNTTYFKSLEQIQIGDIVSCDTNYGEFQYIVDEVSIMNVQDAEDMLERVLGLHEEKLIMYTCYPFRAFGESKENRMFVFAEKLEGPRVIQ